MEMCLVGCYRNVWTTGQPESSILSRQSSKTGAGMFIELQGIYFVLRRWHQNPAATKRQIGIWQHWKQKTEDNDRPLSEVEVNRMKAFLRQNAPTSYFEIFAEERTERELMDRGRI
jgi:hypothetical protein